MNEKEFASMFRQEESSVDVQQRNGAVTGMAFGVLMRKVYTWMTLALAITAGAAYYVAHSDLVYTIANNPAIMWGLIIGELVLIGIALTLISALVGVVAIIRYEPLQILADRS